MSQHKTTLGTNKSRVAQDSIIAKDQKSLFEQHTAADSATQGNDLRQSFGHIVDQKPGEYVGTDFTVAEELHRRTATPSNGQIATAATINQDSSAFPYQQPSSQVF